MNEENVEVQIVLKNHFGEFLGKKSILTEEQYLNLLKNIIFSKYLMLIKLT